jgi:hypothetical protein
MFDVNLFSPIIIRKRGDSEWVTLHKYSMRLNNHIKFNTEYNFYSIKNRLFIFVVQSSVFN